MADRYAVAAGGAWTSTSTWSDTSGGAGGFSVPTSADDVFLDAASGNVTVGSGSVCRSLNCTGYTNTLTVSPISFSIGDGTAGAGNIALKLVAGMTTSINGTSNIRFVSTSATVQDIDFAGKTTGSVTFDGAGGSWRYMGEQAQGAGSTVTLTRGAVDTNGQTLTWGNLQSTSTNVRALTLGSSTITLVTPNWPTWQVNGTNLTLSAASSILILNSTAANFIHTGTSATYGTVQQTGSGAPQLSSTATITTYTRTGTAVKNDSLSIATNITVSGTFTVNGNSVTNRMLVASSGVGMARTITAATVSTSNSDWRDITGAGAGSWDLSAITGLSGDCGGNTNITFTSPTTQTATGTASFTWSTHGWTSRVPLPQDTAVVSNAFIAGRTVTMDMPRVGTIDFTGSTGNVAFTISNSGFTAELYGHLTLRSGMGTVTLGTALHVSMIGASQQNMTMAGNINVSAYNIYVDRSKLQFQDAYTGTAATNGILTRYSGSIDTQGYNVQCALLWLQNTANINLLGSSTFTLTYVGAAAVIDFSAATQARMSAASASFIVNAASTNTRTVALGACSIGYLTYTVASSPGTVLITGGGTIGTLTIGSGRTLQITSGTTIAIGTALVSQGTIAATDLALPGVTGNYASIAHTGVLNITGDIDLRARATLPSWVPGGSRYLIGKWDAGGNYVLSVNATGNLVTSFYIGGVQYSAPSTVATGFLAGTTNWVRSTRNSATGVIKFWISSDGSSWSQLGTDVASTAGATDTTTSALTFGVLRTSDSFGFAQFNISYAQIRNNILDNGTGIVVDADFTGKWGRDSFTEGSSNALTVTINGANLLAADGAVRIRASIPGSAATFSSSASIGTNYISLRDNTASGNVPFYAGASSVSVANNTNWAFSDPPNGNFLQVF